MTDLDETDINKEFIKAIKENDIDTVRLLLQEEKVNVHFGDEDALQNAVIWCQDEIILLLLEYGASARALPNFIVLHCITFGKISTLKILMDNGIDANYHMLSTAVSYGCLDMVKFFIELGLTNFDYFLKSACTGGHHEIAKLFIEHGVDVNTNNNLSMVCANGCTPIVKLLLENGANIHIKNRIIFDADDIIFNMKEFTKKINEYTYIEEFSEAPLFYAVLNGHTDVVKILVEYGANIYVHDQCALTLAAEKGYIDIVRMFIGIGGFSQETINQALVYSVTNAKTDVFDFLLQSGTNIEKNILNILLISCQRGNLYCLKICFENNFDNNYMEMLLSTAIVYNQEYIVKYLIDMNANVYNIDNVLGVAVDRNNYNISKLLIEAGADVYFNNNMALMLAQGNYFEKSGTKLDEAKRIIDLLINHGADKSILKPGIIEYE